MRWEQPLISSAARLCSICLPQDYDSAGHITIDTLAKAMMPVAPQDCTVYFCGPVAWMIDFRGTSPHSLTPALPPALAADPPLVPSFIYVCAAALRWLGVQGNEVHYECFGPEIADIETNRRFPLV